MQLNKKDFDKLTLAEVARRINSIQETLNEIKLFMVGMGVPVADEEEDIKRDPTNLDASEDECYRNYMVQNGMDSLCYRALGDVPGQGVSRSDMGNQPPGKPIRLPRSMIDEENAKSSLAHSERGQRTSHRSSASHSRRRHVGLCRNIKRDGHLIGKHA